MSQNNKHLITLIASATISAGGLTALKQHEGKRNVAYPDAGYGWKVATICYGHTKGVYKGMIASDAECDQTLLKDVRTHLQGMAKCTTAPVTQNQLDAMLSFTFNVGVGAYCNSRLLRLHNLGKCYEAAMEFNDAPQISNGRVKIYLGKPIVDRATGEVLLDRGDAVKKWTTSGGTPFAGLIKRRNYEREQYESGCPIIEGANG